MSHLIADLPGVRARRVAVSSMDNNVYLLTARTGAQVLIDAASDPDAIETMLAEAKADATVPTWLEWVITTHSHADHLHALAAVLARHPALNAAGRADVAAIEAQTGVTVDRSLDHGESIGPDELLLQVIGLRGHTPGSVALALAVPGEPVQLFSGDSLFPGGVGNTGRDPARFASLFSDVVERIFAVYPDDTVVHPGHGASTTLGVERPALDSWRRRGW